MSDNGLVLLAGCHITTPSPGFGAVRFQVGIPTHTGCPVQHKLDPGSIQRRTTAEVEGSINHELTWV